MIPALLVAQTKIPPAPKPNNAPSVATPNDTPSGPTLEETVRFINEQRQSESPLVDDYSVTGDEPQSWHWAITYGKLWVDDDCVLHDQFKVGLNNLESRPWSENRILLNKADPRGIKIEEVSEFNRIADLKRGKDNHYQYEVPIYQIGIFISPDKNLVERVAKAYIHAIALCGGGKDQPF
jgi:hypothetical protein